MKVAFTRKRLSTRVSQMGRSISRDVLVVDSVLNTGVTQDFLLKRLEEGRPHSLRLAVLFDKPESREVNLRPEYTCFAGASKECVGYGLSGRRGLYRNLPYVATTGTPKRARGGK